MPSSDPQALTVGVGTVMDAKEVLVLITGANKAFALYKVLYIHQTSLNYHNRHLSEVEIMIATMAVHIPGNRGGSLSHVDCVCFSTASEHHDYC